MTVRIEAICKHCSTKYSAIPANGNSFKTSYEKMYEVEEPF
jgi:hypothetical protein